MEKLKIKLNMAVKLKVAIEKSIDKDNITIQDANNILDGNTRDIDINEIEDLKNLKSEFLIELGLIVQEANFRKGKGESRTNAYYIKKLSEFQRELKHLTNTQVKNGYVVEDGVKVKYNSFLTTKDITIRQKRLSEEIDILKRKMSKFNESTDVEFQFDPLLKETIQSAGIEV